MTASETAGRLTRVGVFILAAGCLGTSMYAAWRGVASAMPAAAEHGHMPGAGPPGPTRPVMGMPLQEMPEMFVGGLLLIGVCLLLLAVRKYPSSGSARSERPRSWTSRPTLQVIVCTVALGIDVSKTSSLGFVIPGLRSEYALSAQQASLLATAGLGGTTVGALLVRLCADRLATRDVYLVSTLAFALTSSCGMMPTFSGNLVMCFLMGTSVGGLAPVLIAALRAVDTPRSSVLVVCCSLVAAGAGFFVASATAAWLSPVYGWRVLWLVGAPTGLLLAAFTPLVGSTWRVPAVASRVAASSTVDGSGIDDAPVRVGSGIQYAYAALAGVVGFSVTTWTPTLVGASSGGGRGNLTLVAGALMVLAAVLAVCYHRFGEAMLTSLVAITTAGAIVALLASTVVAVPWWLDALALLAALCAVNAMAGVLLPVSVNLAAKDRRMQQVSSVSTFNRLGGLLGPVLLAPLVASRPAILGAFAVLSALCLTLGFVFHTYGRRTTEVARATRQPATR